MTKHLIGYEGSNSPSAVRWGAAAVLVGNELVNTTTGFKITVGSQGSWAEDHQHLVLFEKPIAVPTGKPDPVVVLELDQTHQLHHLLRVDVGKVNVVLAKAQGSRQVFAFASHERFEAYRRIAAARVANAVAYGEIDKEDLRQALAAGLTLAARDPLLNALRVQHTSENMRARAIELTRGLLGPEKSSEFDEFLRAMSEGNTPFSINVEGGIASSGGLNCDDASRIFGAATDAHLLLAPVVPLRYPALRKPEAPRVTQLLAASAHIVFQSAALHGEQSLGERMSRYFGLKLLEEALGGSPPSEVVDASKLETALDRIQTWEGTETEVFQQRMNSTIREPLTHAQATPGRVLPAIELLMFGFQSGLYSLGDRAELVFSLQGSSPPSRIVINTRDNGSGDEPLGAEPLRRSRQAQCEPAGFSVRLERTNWHDRFDLRQMILLSPGSRVRVNAICSGILRGALVTDLDILVERAGADALLVDGAPVQIPKEEPSLETAKIWMREYEARCFAIELQLAEGNRNFRYRTPNKLPKLTDLQAIVCALYELGGSAHQDAVTEYLVSAGKDAWRGNMRRVVIAKGQSLVELVDDAKVFRLSGVGAAYAKLLLIALASAPNTAG